MHVILPFIPIGQAPGAGGIAIADVPGTALRAVLMYIVGMIIVRLGKRRMLGRTTAFDLVLAFILGSLFSRAINGTAAVLPTAAGLTLVAAHWLIARAAYRWDLIDRTVMGRRASLIEDGRTRPDAMRRAEVTEHDLHEALRLDGHIERPEQARLAVLERNGEISVIARRELRVVDVDVHEGVQTVRVELMS